MPKYQIIYSPKSPALNVDMETDVEADRYQVEGRFVTFYKNDEFSMGTPILRVAAAHVLQIKTVG